MPTPAERLRRLFDAGHRLTYADVRRALGITSDRHARRVIRQLQKSGVPVRETRDGLTKRFFLDAEHQRPELPDLDFDPEELYALAVAARASQAALGGTPHGEPLRRAFAKLLDHVAPASYLYDLGAVEHLWHFEEPPPLDAPAEVLRTLEDASTARRSVLIDYYTASRNAWTHGRKVDPLFFARRGRVLLCVAWCHRKGAVRDFAVERIHAAVLCDPDTDPDAFFTPPEGFDPELYFRDRFNVLAGDDNYEVHLRIEPDRVPYWERRQYLPTQQLHRDPDGRVTVSFEVEGLEEIRSFILSWGAGVTVLEPLELAKRVREEAEQLAARYAQGTGDK